MWERKGLSRKQVSLFYGNIQVVSLLRMTQSCGWAVPAWGAEVKKGNLERL